jgi:diguanylate cyclase (GGDEF)-like protein
LSVGERIGLALSNLRLRSELRELAIHDPLTGLHNRRYMEEALVLELSRAERSGFPVGIIMLDIDKFKGFNDGFGHAAGDELLRGLGALIRSNLRAGDIACRYGGEELLIILPQAGAESARTRAEELRERVKGLDIRMNGAPTAAVTISLGVGAYPEHGATRDEVLAAVDAALYRAKKEGRNRTITADKE